ncbi:MAG: iron ABC transporter permease [Rhodothermales bacterium]|nr:iron ABC transporter permease [Rhodothermales bacterium]
MLPRKSAYALLAVLLVIALGWVLYPTLRMFALGLNVDNLQTILGSNSNIRAIINSVTVSLYTVVGGSIVGITLAYVFFRYDFPFRGLLTSIAAVPIALPPLVGVLAFLFLYGESGILPRALQAFFSLESVPFAFDGFWAVLAVHVYTMYVYFYLFCNAALRAFDGSLLEASYDLGAGSFRSFRLVILPYLRPSIVSASLLVFMISMASFTAPLLFAGTEQFMTLQIYNYKTNGNLDLSATVSTILTVICLVFLLLIEWSNRNSGRVATKGTAVGRPVATSGVARVVAATGSLTAITLILLPILTIILISFAREGAWTTQILPGEYTTANYASLFADPNIFSPIRNSLTLAGIATAANILFGVAAAFVIGKTRAIGRTLLRILAILPFAVPGTVIAVNLIITFNQPSPLTFGTVLVGSFWMLPIAYFIRHMPLVVRSTLAALANYDDSLSDASSDLGAGFTTTLRKIVLPVVAPGIVAGSLLTFVAALGEFVSSIMLYIFDNRPISVEIWSQLRLYDFGAAAAYSVLLMLIVILSTGVIRWFGPKSQSIEQAF